MISPVDSTGHTLSFNVVIYTIPSYLLFYLLTKLSDFFISLSSSLCYTIDKLRITLILTINGGVVMFNKILVPVDGSEAAWRALEYATALGEKFHSTITIVHVVQAHYTLPTVGINGEIPFISLNIQEVEATGYKIIELAKERIGDYPTFETNLEFGHPAERIISLASNNAYDLIVIGSRGLSGISEFFLGSISNNVSQSSPVPVMIIK